MCQIESYNPVEAMRQCPTCYDFQFVDAFSSPEMCDRCVVIEAEMLELYGKRCECCRELLADQDTPATLDPYICGDCEFDAAVESRTRHMIDYWFAHQGGYGAEN